MQHLRVAGGLLAPAFDGAGLARYFCVVSCKALLKGADSLRTSEGEGCGVWGAGLAVWGVA